MQEYLDAVDKEIEWCKANMAPKGIDQDSFIKGLEQAKFFIREVSKAKSPLKRNYWYMFDNHTLKHCQQTPKS
jgi:hypothetical protein